MKNNKTKNILICTILLLALIIIMLLSLFLGKLPMNPPGTIGNTAGNLNNGGFFCEYNGKVYFSNPADNGTLYSMNVNETDIRKLNSVKTGNILAGGDFLYYFQTGSSGEAGLGSLRSAKSFNRCKLDGSRAVGLTRDVVVSGQLVDNYLYLLTAQPQGPVFYKMKIDKTEETQLSETNINPACAVNGTIYYNGTTDNHYLYALNTQNDTISEIWQGNLWYPSVDGDYVYYLDVAENYRLCRYSLSQNVIEVLTQDRTDTFNVGNGYIYYQKNSATEPQLKSMYCDGSNVQVIAEGNYCNISMTSQYVYFQEFGNEASLYHTPLGGIGYSSFQAE